MLGLPSLKDIGYLLIAAVLGIAASWLWGKWQYHEGALHQREKNALVQTITHKASVRITKEIVTQYVPKIKVIKEKGQTIIKKVPIYVTKQDDSRCVVPNRFVSLWNSSNEMRLPTASEAADDKASPIGLSDIARQHTEDATQYNQIRTQLIALQDWIRQQQALYSQ